MNKVLGVFLFQKPPLISYQSDCIPSSVRESVGGYIVLVAMIHYHQSPSSYPQFVYIGQSGWLSWRSTDVGALWFPSCMLDVAGTQLGPPYHIAISILAVLCLHSLKIQINIEPIQPLRYLGRHSVGFFNLYCLSHKACVQSCLLEDNGLQFPFNSWIRMKLAQRRELSLSVPHAHPQRGGRWEPSFQ